MSGQSNHSFGRRLGAWLRDRVFSTHRVTYTKVQVLPTSADRTSSCPLSPPSCPESNKLQWHKPIGSSSAVSLTSMAAVQLGGSSSSWISPQGPKPAPIEDRLVKLEQNAGGTAEARSSSFWNLFRRGKRCTAKVAPYQALEQNITQPPSMNVKCQDRIDESCRLRVDEKACRTPRGKTPSPRSEGLDESSEFGRKTVSIVAQTVFEMRDESALSGVSTAGVDLSFKIEKRRPEQGGGGRHALKACRSSINGNLPVVDINTTGRDSVIHDDSEHIRRTLGSQKIDRAKQRMCYHGNRHSRQPRGERVVKGLVGNGSSKRLGFAARSENGAVMKRPIISAGNKNPVLGSLKSKAKIVEVPDFDKPPQRSNSFGNRKQFGFTSSCKATRINLNTPKSSVDCRSRKPVVSSRKESRMLTNVPPATFQKKFITGQAETSSDSCLEQRSPRFVGGCGSENGVIPGHHKDTMARSGITAFTPRQESRRCVVRPICKPKKLLGVKSEEIKRRFGFIGGCNGVNSATVVRPVSLLNSKIPMLRSRLSKQHMGNSSPQQCLSISGRTNKGTCSIGYIGNKTIPVKHSRGVKGDGLVKSEAHKKGCAPVPAKGCGESTSRGLKTEGMLSEPQTKGARKSILRVRKRTSKIPVSTWRLRRDRDIAKKTQKHVTFSESSIELKRERELCVRRENELFRYFMDLHFSRAKKQAEKNAQRIKRTRGGAAKHSTGNSNIQSEVPDILEYGCKRVGKENTTSRRRMSEVAAVGGDASSMIRREPVKIEEPEANNTRQAKVPGVNKVRPFVENHFEWERNSDEEFVYLEALMEQDALQEEQWELAAQGEWSYICHDEDEDEEETEDYLSRNDEEKDLMVERNLQSIISRYREVGALNDLIRMSDLPGSPRGKVKQAVLKYARICRGPVPLAFMGQEKAEAVSSVSTSLRCETRKCLHGEVPPFKDLQQVFNELEILRERQKKLENYLKGVKC